MAPTNLVHNRKNERVWVGCSEVSTPTSNANHPMDSMSGASQLPIDCQLISNRSTMFSRQTNIKIAI